MEKLISEIDIKGKRGTDKVIIFEKNGKVNYNQMDYFNALFYPDLSLRTNFNEFGYFGGFRCGKSFGQQASVFIICSKYPGVRCLYVRDTYDQLKASVIKQFNEEFEHLGNYTYFKTDRKAVFSNGSEIYFRAFNYDTDILSTEYDLIASCQTEDINEETFLQFLGRLSGKRLPRPLLLSEGNPAGNYVKDRYKDQPDVELKRKGIFSITNGQTSDNPHVTADYIQRIKDNYPTWWIARYLNSEWNNIADMVFDSFRESEHVVEPIDDRFINGFRQRGGFDYAYRTPAALNWSYVDTDGNITIYDEWNGIKQDPEQIYQASKRHDLPKRRVLFVADFSIKAPDRDGRNLWDELVSKGMVLTEASKDEMNNIILTNMMFKQGRLKITRNCVDTIKEVSNWKWKEAKLGSMKDLPDEPVDKDNHHCDNINYIISNLEGVKSADPKVAAYKKTLEYANIHANKSVSHLIAS